MREKVSIIGPTVTVDIGATALAQGGIPVGVRAIVAGIEPAVVTVTVPVSVRPLVWIVGKIVRGQSVAVSINVHPEQREGLQHPIVLKEGKFTQTCCNMSGTPGVYIVHGGVDHAVAVPANDGELFVLAAQGDGVGSAGEVARMADSGVTTSHVAGGGQRNQVTA